jgi:hypothetical protein
MTATNTLSAAILRRRYQSGITRANFNDFPVYDGIEKKTDFKGDDYALAIKTENPQGVGTSVPNAQGAAAQSTYKRALLTRVEYFGIARIKGQALRTATMRGDGALVDLWTEELDGIEKSVIKMLEIFSMGTGNGVLGTISTGVTGATVTLTVAEDVNNFDLGMKVKLVSDTTLSPTVRSGEATITSLNRATGTLTLAAGNWNAIITGATNGDSIVRSGDQAASATNNVPAGMRQWLIGGSSPGTWKSLTRNDDPVRLASQTLDMTGLPMAEAIIDLESLVTIQGKTSKKRLICNPRDFRQVKKTLYGKVAFSSGGGSPTIGFDGAKWQGDGGDIPPLLSPFCPKQNVFLKNMSSFAMYSAGPAPQPLEDDKNQILRLATDDAYEARIGLYGDFGDNAPVESIRGTGWGA